jgi:hypothetical protein
LTPAISNPFPYRTALGESEALLIAPSYGNLSLFIRYSRSFRTKRPGSSPDCLLGGGQQVLNLALQHLIGRQADGKKGSLMPQKQ